MKKPRFDLAAQIATLGADSLLPPGYKPPKALDAVADKVLRYRPKAKSVAAKRRKRRAGKIARERNA